MTLYDHPATWDYKQNGRDWPQIERAGHMAFHECNETRQSPIDLSMDNVSSTYSPSKDAYGKVYSNPRNPTIEWMHVTSKLIFDKNDVNFFSSYYSESEFGTDRLWQGAELHWHHPSEHTIEGKHYDLELHVLHLPNEKEHTSEEHEQELGGRFKYAVQAYLFEAREDAPDWMADEVIDPMFDSLNWNVTDSNSTVQEVLIGDFLQKANTNDRFVYEGSLTTPPCTTSIYWNVASTVYPIKPRHLEQFKQQLGRNKDYDLLKNGNHREV
jgi:carbonic anhydrase